MKHTTILVLAGAGLFAAGQSLDTDYAQERAFRIETETVISMETTHFEVERDGEPMNFGGGGGGGTEESMTSVVIDTVLEHEGGKPMRVQRVFEELAADLSMSMRGETMDMESDCPLSGCSLEITVDEDGETSAEIVDGDEPDDDTMLEGHHAALALDALLPSEDVEEGDSWTLEPQAVRRALGVDLRRKLFPRPRPEGGGGGGEERGRGGRRGGRSRAGGGGSVFALAEWEGEATLSSMEDEYDDMPCALIELTFSAAGDMPEPEPRERGEGRRGRMPVMTRAAAPLFESGYEIEIKGRLYVSLEENRPVAAEFEGSMLTDQRTERERGESVMVMSMTREGTYERTVTVSAVALEKDAD